MKPDPWAFGWDALVALGTLSLSFVTLALVIATRGLARQANAEVRAQWRPVLLVRDRIPVEIRLHGRGIVQGGGKLTVWVENVGRGPAFDVQARLPDFGLPGPGYGVPEGAAPLSGAMSTRLYTAIAPGDLLPYEWSGLGEMPEEGGMSGSFFYTDMAGASLSTSFYLNHDRQRGPQLASQGIEEQPLPVLPLWRRLVPWCLVYLPRRLYWNVRYSGSG
jgi:hypothetical protein